MTIVHIMITLTLAILASLVSQEQSAQPLLDEVKTQLRIKCYDEADCVPIEERLLHLGQREQVFDVLLALLKTYRLAKPTEPEYAYLSGSVVALGKLKERRAIPMLSEIVRSKDAWDYLRVFAVQAIAGIDPEGSRDLLLEQLRSSDMSIRRESARGLSKIRDRTVIIELDVAASREDDPRVRRDIQGLADALRLQLNLPSTPVKQ